jgi:hypothetical protein
LFLPVKKLTTNVLSNGYPGNRIISGKGFNGKVLAIILGKIGSYRMK